MAAQFRIDVDASELVDAIKDFERRGGNLGPTMAIVADMLVTAVQDEFETEGRGEWPAFAESTLATRAGGKLLQDSGIFAGSISAESGSDFAEANTGVEYAIHHVFGAPAAGIPQRNPFDVEDSVFEEAAALVAGAIAGP